MTTQPPQYPGKAADAVFFWAQRFALCEPIEVIISNVKSRLNQFFVNFS